MPRSGSMGANGEKGDAASGVTGDDVAVVVAEAGVSER